MLWEQKELDLTWLKSGECVQLFGIICTIEIHEALALAQ
jgi:hypothetical protein